MYAKLKFKGTATSAQRNRCIVKAIQDCYSGPASAPSLNGYAGLDSGGTRFYSTDSSHWHLTGDTALGSSTLDYDTAQAYRGGAYSLKCILKTGHTAYVDVRLAGNYQNSSIYTGPRSGSYIMARNCVGTSREEIQYGNTTMTNHADADIANMGPSHAYDRDIHVFADQDKIMLCGGASGSATTGKNVHGYWAFERPSSFRYMDTVNTIKDSNLAVIAYHHDGGGLDLGSSTVVYRDGAAWNSTWDNATTHGSFKLFPGHVHNLHNSKQYRNMGYTAGHRSTYYVGYLNETLDQYAVPDDGTTARPTASEVVTDTDYQRRMPGFNPSADMHRPGYSRDVISNNAYSFNENGKRQITLIPMIQGFEYIGGDVVDMSKQAGVYMAAGNGGFFGDSAEINGSFYHYFPTSTTTAMVIRRN